MTCRYLSSALDELREAAEFYEGRVPGLGADFLDEVDATISRICQFPEAWARLSNQFRRCNLRRFPYMMVYTILDSDELLVVSLFHQSREPNSWRKNL